MPFIHAKVFKVHKEQAKLKIDIVQVTERGISELRGQLDELEQLQGAVSRQLPGGAPGLVAARGEPGGPGRLRDLLECPVCMEEMKPPKKIFQCSNGHVICELCKNNPEVRRKICQQPIIFLSSRFAVVQLAESSFVDIPS